MPDIYTCFKWIARNIGGCFKVLLSYLACSEIRQNLLCMIITLATLQDRPKTNMAQNTCEKQSLQLS